MKELHQQINNLLELVRALSLDVSIMEAETNEDMHHLHRVLSYEQDELIKNKNQLELYEKEIARITLMINASLARINSINVVFFKK